MSQPNDWQGGYTHKAFLPCPLAYMSDHDDDCLRCHGLGIFEVGCGGAAEKDQNHPLANCFGCGHLVDPLEVTRVATVAR